MEALEGIRSAAAPDRASLARGLHVLVALARSDLRIRYGRGLWQVVNWFVTPFFLVGVYVVLRVILDRSGEAIVSPIASPVRSRITRRTT